LKFSKLLRINTFRDCWTPTTMAGPMDIAKARRLVGLLPPKLTNFFTRYPPRNPAIKTLYSEEDKSISIAKKLHDFQSIPSKLHQTVIGTSETAKGNQVKTVFLPFQNPFKPSRDPRTGKFHAPRYSLRRQADIIKLALRFGVADLLPPSAKMHKLLNGKTRPMAGTLRPKGTLEERNRKSYVEKKQKSLEESLRVVAMRKVVSSYIIFMTYNLVARYQKESGTKTECANGRSRTILPIEYACTLWSSQNSTILTIWLSLTLIHMFALSSMLLRLTVPSFLHNF
jgi:large subunit ribosomal protein L25